MKLQSHGNEQDNKTLKYQECIIGLFDGSIKEIKV